MTRNLKTLGLALMAILALCAVVASAASAQTLGKITSDGPVTLTATQGTTGTGAYTTGKNFFKSFGSEINCTHTLYKGHKIDQTPHALIPSGATEVTITPTYTGCEVTGGRQATVTMNGCDFEFSDFTTTVNNTPNEYTFDARLDCAHTKKVEVHVYSESHDKAEGSELCTLTMSDTSGAATVNQGLTGTLATSDPNNDDVGLNGVFKGIHVTRHGLCLFDGQGSTSATAEYGVDVTVTGETGAGVPTGITITH
jgi:hypothetical protein